MTIIELMQSRITPAEIEKTFRDEAGRALATLIRLVGDFDLAEDALQDAFAAALQRWPAADPPSNPRAWLVNVGRNKANSSTNCCSTRPPEARAMMRWRSTTTCCG